MNSDRAFVIFLLSIGWVKARHRCRSTTLKLQPLGIAREISINRGLLEVWAWGWLPPSPSAMLRAGRWFGKLAWKGVKSKVWAFAISNVGLRCPSFEGVWEGQKVKGLGLGWLPPSSLVMLRLA